MIIFDIIRGGGLLAGGLCPLQALCMSSYSLSIHSFYKRLVYKFRDDPLKLEQLHNICWFSFPVVYPNYFYDCLRCEHELDLFKQKRKRIRKYIRGMISTYGTLYLVTLTFTDDYVNKGYDLLKRYVRDYLNSVCLDYFACVDFGKKNGRIHFHALACISYELYPFKLHNTIFHEFVDSSFAWPYGFSSIRLIGSGNVDFHKSLNYAFKSSSYAFKSSDSVYKPFHKRGVTHWYSLAEGESLFW